ncbi:MAG: VF530 family protein, partial [Reinekea sp.]|nr:VF530 family protein [Reinekea sp.]
MTEQYFNNPLHGLKLEALVTELVDFYGFEILAAALNFNCFKLNPSIKGSVKFLKKTEWARQKLEIFYLYKYKNLPRPDAKQY